MDELGIDVLAHRLAEGARPPAGPRAFFRSSPGAQAGRAIQIAAITSISSSSKKTRSRHDAQHAEHPHIYALRSKLDDIFAESIEARHARHAKLNGMVHDWVRRQGFEFFAPEAYRS